MEIQDILLLQDVGRWGIVRVSKRQSVAEHTFNVTMIARAIAKEAGVPDNELIKYALDHDIDEVMTGDIPSPAKVRMGIKGKGYEGNGRSLCTAQQALIVEVADIMEACIFLSENGLGRHAQVVSQSLAIKLVEKMQFADSQFDNIGTACQRVFDAATQGKYEAEKTEVSKVVDDGDDDFFIPAF